MDQKYPTDTKVVLTFYPRCVNYYNYKTDLPIDGYFISSDTNSTIANARYTLTEKSIWSIVNVIEDRIAFRNKDDDYLHGPSVDDYTFEEMPAIMKSMTSNACFRLLPLKDIYDPSVKDIYDPIVKDIYDPIFKDIYDPNDVKRDNSSSSDDIKHEMDRYISFYKDHDSNYAIFTSDYKFILVATRVDRYRDLLSNIVVKFVKYEDKIVNDYSYVIIKPYDDFKYVDLNYIHNQPELVLPTKYYFKHLPIIHLKISDALINCDRTNKFVINRNKSATISKKKLNPRSAVYSNVRLNCLTRFKSNNRRIDNKNTNKNITPILCKELIHLIVQYLFLVTDKGSVVYLLDGIQKVTVSDILEDGKYIAFDFDGYFPVSKLSSCIYLDGSSETRMKKYKIENKRYLVIPMFNDSTYPIFQLSWNINIQIDRHWIV